MNHRLFLNTRHFGSLDGLRALSILAVLWHHSGLPQTVPLLQRGQTGVQLFFAISGFLITTLMIRERRATGTISMRAFYARRSLRIFPLYYAVLAVYTVLVLATDQGEAGRAFLDHLPAFATYTSNWFVPFSGDDRIIFYFAWSLATEEQFYLTWPWIERYASPRLRRLLLGLLVAVMAATHFGLLAGLIGTDSFVHVVLQSIAPPIVFGVIVAHVLHTPRGYASLSQMFGSRAAAPALLVLLIGELCVPRGGVLLEYVVYATLVALVCSCVIREDNGLAPLLKLPPLVRLGIVSYGVYLMHMLTFNAMHVVGPRVGVTSPVLLWLAGVLGVYVAAEISFRTFERFFLRRKPHRVAAAAN